jgi:putative phosphotransacetylase
VRVKETYALDFHVDTDEANAFGLNNGDLVTVILED